MPRIDFRWDEGRREYIITANVPINGLYRDFEVTDSNLSRGILQLSEELENEGA
jgi:hypothetical protein